MSDNSVFIQNIKVRNFRNISEAELHFSHQFIAFTGSNGLGKTNLLDAIYYCCIGKSYFSSADGLVVKKDNTFFTLTANLKTETEKQIHLSWNGKKQIRHDGNVLERISHHVGKFPVVMIAPTDNELIIGGSEDRRKFMDTLLCQADNDYLNALQQYNQILVRRNALLKQYGSGASKEVLGYYDVKLAEFAAVLLKQRTGFVTFLNQNVAKTYRSLSNGAEIPKIGYSKGWENDLLSTLKNERRIDMDSGRTTSGPHKDDLEFLLDDLLVKKFASQGQQKSLLIALKLAQLHYLQQIKQLTPILLLDDIFEKLDAVRLNNLFQYIKLIPKLQVIITDTNYDRVQALLENEGLSCDYFHFSSKGIVANLLDSL